MWGLSSIPNPVVPLADITTYGMPEAKSSVAEMVDSHYAFINVVNVFFFVLILVVMAYVLMRYRKPAGEKAESDVSHNTALEVTWTVIPVILVIIIFGLGFHGYNIMVAAPADSYVIQVQAQQWSWSFQYPDGFTSDYDPGAFNEDKSERVVTDEVAGLHLPPGVPIELKMTSADVLHSFFVPEFRVKQDVVPGKISTVWFEPSVPEGPDPDRYWLLCTEYCGTSHSDMLSTVYVHPTWESFEQWKVRANTFPEDMTWEQRGEILYRRKGCAQCHSVEPNAPGVWTGPTWVGLWGKTADEHPVHVGAANGPIENIAVIGEEGEQYLFESIRNPMARITAGYTAAMPIKKLSEEEIWYLISYIKTLGKSE